MDMLGRDAARDTANMEFQAVVAMPVGHRIAARRHAIEPDLRILSCGEQQGLTVRRRKPHKLDIVRQILEAGDNRLNLPWRFDGVIVIAAQPGDGRIRLRHRTTGEDQAVSLFVFGEREARMLKELNLTLDQARLAGSATAGSAAMRIGDASGKCRIEEGLAHTDAVKPKERKHLTEAQLAAGYRMACQTFVLGDIAVSW